LLIAFFIFFGWAEHCWILQMHQIISEAHALLPAPRLFMAALGLLQCVVLVMLIKEKI